MKGDVVARIEALNRELRSLLLPAFKDELILFETPDKIAFVLNLKNPDDTDKKTLALIRTKVSERDLGVVFKFRAPSSCWSKIFSSLLLASIAISCVSRSVCRSGRG